MNVLITGGLGFVGLNLSAWLLAKGASVRVFDVLSKPPAPSLLDPRVALCQGDVRDSDAVRQAVRDMDVVVHLAAEPGVLQSLEAPLRSHAVNNTGTLHVLEAARQGNIRKLIFGSSNAVLGGAVPGQETTLPRPLTPYGVTKLAGEAYCAAYTASFGVPTVSLRFSNLYGPHSFHKSSVVASFLKRALAGEPLSLAGGGRQTRDFLHVDDLAVAIGLAIDKAPAGSVFQIGSGVETSIRALALHVQGAVREQAGIEVPVVDGPVRPGEVERNYSDISLARTALDFRPDIPLEIGIPRTVQWFCGAVAAAC